MALQIKTMEQEFHYGSVQLRVKRVKNLDDLVDQIDDSQFAVDERLPYWAELWPSAIGLSRYLIDHPQTVSNKSVLELGCGLGLTSMVLARQNPKSLVCTDYEQDALDMTAENFRLNHLPLPELHLLDWRQPQLKARFEVLVASDVLYEERFFEPLKNVFRQLLSPGGQIIIAEPGRPVAVPFLNSLHRAGYGHQKESLDVRQDDKKIRVGIHLLS